ncbi:DUF4188 domain-containing protein [uncultured Deinococcus sp.]|uniref:DUF4188 domain-containing protein n=1 Tax=uncultured Deinococcus sp. TaxID=158789 RepID=UPI003749DDFE
MPQPAPPHSPRRLTAEMDGTFAVFLIGMRINQPWKVWAWLPVVLAMPRMLRELGERPDLGLLATQMQGGLLVQYWRDVQSLNAYARSRDHAHLPAWREFNHRARRARGAVGIWHETYVVGPGQYETVYVDMPRYGLGRAGRLVEAGGHRQSAEGRLRGGPADARPA